MMITGMIITTMMAHISHHRMPRLAGILGGDHDRHGLRLGGREEHGEQIFVPVQDERQQRGGGKAGPRQRQDDIPENAKPRGAIELGRFLQLDGQAGEEIMHQPHDDRQIGHGIDDDQRQMGVEQADRLEHHVDRNDDDDRRQDALRNDPEQDVAIAERGLEMLAEGARQKEEQRQGHGRRNIPVECRHSWSPR